MILPMARVELLGPRELLPEVLAFVQAQGVLELRTPGAALAPVPSEEAGLEARLGEGIRRLDAIEDRLPAARPADRPEPLPPPGSPALLERLVALEEELVSLEARRAALREEAEATARFVGLVVALAPLAHGVSPEAEPELHGLVLRTDPAALALLEGEVRRLSGGDCEVKARALDPERTGVLVVVPRAAGRALTALLLERGVDEVHLPAACAGKRLVEVLLHLAAREREIPRELAGLDVALARIASAYRPALRAARAAALAELGRIEAARRCAETRFAFVVAGYMPAERVEGLRRAAAAELGARVSVFSRTPDRAEWGEVPVVLRNRSGLRPFERLLALVPLPRYGSVDPTPFLAVFFPLFFGLVLGDLAFGAVGVGAALLARGRGWGGAAGRDLAWVALWCSVSAAAFGVLFGEALGELGAHAGLHPILLDRRRSVLGLLAAAIALGGAHVLLGMALGVASALTGGHRREALARSAKLVLLLGAGVAALALAGVLPRAVLRPVAVTGGAALVLAIAAEGPMAALDLVLGLGNVLSYSRLMALGLASAMLADVANGIAGELRPAAAGIALGVLLHAVNFSLGLISPTVAALRLHYVEFFEKFYDAGGAPYRPFALA